MRTPDTKDVREGGWTIHLAARIREIGADPNDDEDIRRKKALLVLLAVLIFWMYHVLAHRPGGQPIGALEKAASKSWAFVRGLLPRPGIA